MSRNTNKQAKTGNASQEDHIYESFSSRYSTQMRVFRAAAELMQNMPFSKLTVTDICDHAGVSRQTFYRNFSDKEGIAIWHFARIFENGLWSIGLSKSWHDANLWIFTQIQAERDFYAGITATEIISEYRSIGTFAIRLTKRVLSHIIEKRNATTLTPELRFQIGAYASMAVDSGCEWVLAGMKEDPEVMASFYDDCIPCKLYAAVTGEDAL